MGLVIYKSSAGSGKTFTLVKEYLKIVLKNPHDYKHILAMTFTNKATEEMKSRIIDELGFLSAGEENDMFKSLIDDDDFPVKSKKKIFENARITLHNILHNYARFEVSTIDSFFTRIIRSCSRELNLPPTYSIDIDSGKALEQAIEGLYASLDDYPELQEWFRKFTDEEITENKGWSIDRKIKKLGNELFKEKFNKIRHEGELNVKTLSRLIAGVKKSIREFENQLKEFSDETKSLIAQYGLVDGDFKSSTIKFITERIPAKEYDKITATFLKVVNNEGEWYTQKSKKKGEIDAVAAAGLNELARQIVDFIEINHPKYIADKAIISNIYSYGILSALVEELKKYRDEKNLLLISDTNSIIKEIMSDQADAPFLMEKVGSIYKHIFIDEFQDTSDYQWGNLKALVINALSEGNRVLIVGDAKQSIYRWRGGNMKLLLEEIEKDLISFIGPNKEEIKVLENNFRSKTNIVNFNNSFFSLAKELLANSAELGKVELIEMAYNEINQIPQKDEGGYVKIHFFEKEGNSAQKANAEMLATLAEDLNNAIQKGYKYNDAMILVRNRADSFLIANYLSLKGIPFISQQSLLVANAPNIKLLISCLEYLNDITDSLLKTKLLFQYLDFTEQLEMIDLDKVFRDHETRVAKDAKDKKIESLFLKYMPFEISSNHNAIVKKPIIEIVEDLTNVLKLNTDADVYLQRFQDKCIEIARMGHSNIPEFLDYWYEKQQDISIINSDGTNAVRVMTIHSAKGLEKPIVFLPFSNYSFRPKSNSTLWIEDLEAPYEQFKILPIKTNLNLSKSLFKEDYLDEISETIIDSLNTAYVAFTRPKEQMYIYSHWHKDASDMKYLNKLIIQILSSSEFSFHENWNAENKIFELGTNDHSSLKESIEKEEETIKYLENYPSEAFGTKINIKDKAEHYFELLSDEIAAKIQTGNKLHAILEEVKSHSDLKGVLDNHHLDGRITENEKVEYAGLIEKLFETPEFKDWFSGDWETIPEQTIFNKGSDKRPDKILLKGKEAVVIDYKKEKEVSKYKKQIKEYGQLVKAIPNGPEEIKLYLVYIESGDIKEVEFD